MDIQTRKIEFIRAFLSLQSEDTISQLEELLKKRQAKEGDFKPMSIDELNNRIDKSEGDFKNNCYKPTPKLLAKY